MYHNHQPATNHPALCAIIVPSRRENSPAVGLNYGYLFLFVSTKSEAIMVVAFVVSSSLSIMIVICNNNNIQVLMGNILYFANYSYD